MHVGRWDLEEPRYEPGAWLHGTIYPQRCDLSPDGRWLAYFALKGSARWELGATYVAISRLPSLTAIVAWGTDGTWTRGMHFVEDPSVWEVDEPERGDAREIRDRFGLRMSLAHSFAVERRRGWTETAATPPREADDAWDDRRGARIRMEKARPGSAGSTRLRVEGTYVGMRELHGVHTDIGYSIDLGGEQRELDGIGWADWDERRRLLVATLDGRLQIRGSHEGPVEWEADEGVLVPDPAPPGPYR